MKTVKEVSEITGVSIRTLRYYDEIGLLKPAGLTEAGYRLYDNAAIERLQEIMFYRELEIPLIDIKEILEDPDHDREQVLLTQKRLLERKRNRLNGIIELISDMAKGVNTMSFEAFTDGDVKKIFEHSLELQGEDSIQSIIERFGSIEAFREEFSKNLKDEKISSHLIKIYGSKEKAVEASLQAAGDREGLKKQQDEIDEVYRQFALAMEKDDQDLAGDAVEKLAESYKAMFRLDNARYLLLEVAKDYLNHSQLEAATDSQYGDGVTQYIGHAIELYYGVTVNGSHENKLGLDFA